MLFRGLTMNNNDLRKILLLNRGTPPPIWLPTDISGNIFFLRSDVVTKDEVNRVSIFTDQGNGNDFTQNTDAKKYVWTPAVLDGHAGLYADGIDDEISGGDLSSYFPSAATLYIIAQPNNDTNYDLYIDSANWGILKYGGASYVGTFLAARKSIGSVDIPSSGAHIFMFESSSLIYKVSVDDVLKIDSTPNFSVGTNHIMTYDIGGQGRFCGWLFETFAYNKILSILEKAQVQSYLATRYPSI
jgi:hypothetical protein